MSLVYCGADARPRCEALGNSTLHLALLSARDEVCVGNSELWTGNSRDLQLILTILLNDHAEISMQNHAGFTPSDVAIGLKCTKSWNNAMQVCGLTEHVIDASYSNNGFGQDLLKRFRFNKWREDYNHLTRWLCRPDSCNSTEQSSCGWWVDYTTQWLPFWRWDAKFSTWEEL